MIARGPWRVATIVAVVALLCGPHGRAAAGDAGPRPTRMPTTVAGPELPGANPLASDLVGPYHGSLDGIAFGGEGELRFANDRVRGVSNPEWFSVGRVEAFLRARIHSRMDLAGEVGWDRSTDDFGVERAELRVRAKRALEVHAGIFPTPLGRANLQHDTPQNEFDELSLVATQLIGVPMAQLGVGVRGSRGGAERSPLAYEIDLVTGYGDGLVMDSPGGTRLPKGRNNYGDNNGIPALAGRIAVRPSRSAEIGVSAQSGQYNQTEIGGVRVDEPRYVHLVVTDGVTRMAGLNVSGEAAAALIDTPPGLGGLYAERQWGGSVELNRTLLDPILHSWRSWGLTAAVRADAVDFDRSIPGDSRSRLSASLNVHRRPYSVTRFSWYYEIRRDRFNNVTPMAGVTFSAASYF